MPDHRAAKPFLKICGITRLDDAETLLDLEVDALGLMFYKPSPRYVTLETAGKIARLVAGSVKRVGVFVDAPATRVQTAINRVGLDILQFQGNETPGYCASFGLPYVRALRVSGPLDYRRIEDEYAGALAIHLDTFVAGALPGGTGHPFDWRQWPERPGLNYVLAGGLTPDNVRSAVRDLRPWGVDVSSGVESDVKGIKEPGKMRRFVEEVRGASSR